VLHGGKCGILLTFWKIHAEKGQFIQCVEYYEVTKRSSLNGRSNTL